MVSYIIERPFLFHISHTSIIIPYLKFNVNDVIYILAKLILKV